MMIEIWVEFDRQKLTEAMFPSQGEQPPIRIINLNKAEAVDTEDGKVRIKLTVGPNELVGFINASVGGRPSSEDKHLARHANS